MASITIGIVGAGIAGLAAAIAVHRAGHEAIVFEKASEHNELGAAICIPPNGARILRAWGLDASTSGETVLLRNGNLPPEAQRMQLRQDLSDAETRYGAPFLSFHRRDLHRGLRDLAQKLSVSMRLGCEVADVDPKKAIVVLRDGSRYNFDFVIIADGVYSSLIPRITGMEAPLTRSGRSVYRTSLMPIAELSAKYPKASATLELQTGCTICGHMNPTTGEGALVYPCRSGSMLNFLIFHPSLVREGAKDRWNMPGDLQDAKAVLEKSNTAFQAVLNSAVEVREYDMAYRDTLSCYHNDRAIIIGDAAHPMLPMHAAGATSALEDAAALEVLLSGSFCAGVSLPHLLALWQALRLPRDATIQILSNTASERPGFSTRPIENRIRQYYRGPLPEALAIGWSKETTDFLMSYDAFKEAEKALKWAHKTSNWPEKLARDELPEGVVQHFGIHAVAD